MGTPVIRHNFQSAVADSNTNGIIKPSHWNDSHAISLNSGALVGRATTGSGTAEEVIPDNDDFTLALDGSTPALSLKTILGTPGTFYAANITVDAKGRITAVTNGSPNGGNASALKQFFVPAADPDLPNARAPTNTSTISWDVSTAGQFAANWLGLETDTSPSLGGNLDLDTHDITGTGNINITGTVTATSVTVGDEAYDAAGWNGDLTAPTKNAVRDYLETLTGTTLPAAYQPLDSDLTALAALTTQAYGRGLLEYANEAAFKAGVNLEIGVDVQAYSSVLANTTASFTTTDETKLDYITVTQAVDLDAIERRAYRDVYVDDHGAVGDGSTLDTTAFAAAFTAMGSTGGIVWLNQTKKYRIGSITVPANVTLQGHLVGLDGTADNVNWDFASLGSALLLASGASITLSEGAALKGTIVRPYGMSLDQSDSSAWADSAVIIDGHGAAVINNIILGFENAVFSDGFSRLRIEWNAIDANNGINVQGTYDSSRILNNHCWPYLTHKAFWNSGVDYASRDKTMLYRTGEGIYLADGTDDTHVDGNLFYGFKIGMRFFDSGAVNGGRNWVDHPNGVNRTDNYGVVFEGTVDNLLMQGLFIWGTKYGLYSGSTGTVTIDLLHVETTDVDAVSLNSGNIRIGHLNAHGAGGRAVTVSHATDVTLDLDSWDFRGIGATEAISLPPGATTENIFLGQGTSDEADGTALCGTNNLLFPDVASASTLNLPAHGTWFTVTGTTTINSIAGVHGGRRIVLRFAGSCTVAASGGNITLDAPFASGGAGGTLELYYDGASTTWRELSRNIGHVIGPSSATDGNIVLFDGATGRKVKESSFALTTLTGAWTSYTPTVTPSAGSFTSVTATGKYKTIGKTTFVIVSVTITTNGTASGGWTFSLPNTSANDTALQGRENAVTGHMCIANVIGTIAFVVKYDNSTIHANGSQVTVSGVYENT